MNNQNKKNPLFNESIDFTSLYTNDGCGNIEKNNTKWNAVFNFFSAAPHCNASTF